MFVKANFIAFPVATMREVFGVSRSIYAASIMIGYVA